MSEPAETNDCSACGFVGSAVTPTDAVAALRGFGRRYRAPLTRFLPGEDGISIVRQRPESGPLTWSALEYACHVRDVFAWYDTRVTASLVEDRPVFGGPDPDEAATENRYNDAHPTEVADELAANAERLAATFESVGDDQWDRLHVRRGHERSVLFAAQRAAHEGNHHLLDIGRVLRAVRDRNKGAATP